MKKKRTARERNKYLLSRLSVKERAAQASTKRDMYMTVQSLAANSKLNSANMPKKGSEVGG